MAFDRFARHPRLARIAGACAILLAFGREIHAQPALSGPNTGALTFTGGIDAPSVYFFRGMRQEGEPRLTVQPYGDLGIALARNVRVNLGVWNSLNTGTSGTGGPPRLGGLHGGLNYEERFYSTLTLGFAERLSLASTYEAYTSPNGSFTTVKEMNFKVAENGRFAPYGFLAFELSDAGQADGGFKKGTYFELGAAPRVSILRQTLTLSVPVKAGFSLKDYYELVGAAGSTTDHKFGFFDVGGLVTAPLSFIPPRFGSWNVHGGADWLALGDTTKAFNKGDAKQVIGSIGVGVTY